MAVPFAQADDDLQDQQKQVEKQIERAHDELDETSAAMRRAQGALDAAQAELDAAVAELAAVRERLDAARERDAEMAEALAKAEDRLSTAESDLAEGQQALADQRTEVTDSVNELYQQGDPQLMSLTALMNSGSLGDLTRQQQTDRVISSNQTEVYDELDAAEVLLQVREDQLSEARDDVAQQREAAAANLATMRALTAQAVAGREKVRDKVAVRLDARREASAALAKDRALLSRLRNQEARIKQQIMEAARASRGTSVSASADGFLLPPVTGPVTSPFGMRTHPIYGYYSLHDGTDFGVACGEGMRASGDGTVISKYYSSVYGNRLYVNLGQVNGKNLTVVYNHASGYRVDVGDRVSTGEIVGYVGDTGWSTGCHLHYTVLVNGNAVDPMTWM
ncbi:peptidoglycan DD-metalloendopeptidase family protein [Nocardioides sp. Leaf374]|uniref:peptidoglycan DD-metalloendopeptidase family protein n=1 Tax=Nocardioides sp. Leaf374 TaxID=2876560 RepID=UPI001E356E39|nr:peptidoglycan DD-metalloendopeptidase family protein [Nocardioides sp. Leaf374]